jgi:hypothetical protein
MRLFEFQLDDPLRVKLVAATNQLKSKMEEANANEPMSTTAFLSLLRDKFDITIDKSDIYDMIKKDPLRNIIGAIEDDKIIFKGMARSKPETPNDDSEQIVAKMAKRAMK